MASQPVGFFSNSEGKSSKRLQSFLGLLAALIFPLVCGAFNLKLPVAEITTGFLTYSALMQGVSVYQEVKANGKARQK